MIKKFFIIAILFSILLITVSNTVSCGYVSFDESFTGNALQQSWSKTSSSAGARSYENNMIKLYSSFGSNPEWILHTHTFSDANFNYDFNATALYQASGGANAYLLLGTSTNYIKVKLSNSDGKIKIYDKVNGGSETTLATIDFTNTNYYAVDIRFHRVGANSYNVKVYINETSQLDNDYAFTLDGTNTFDIRFYGEFVSPDNAHFDYVRVNYKDTNIVYYYLTVNTPTNGNVNVTSQQYEENTNVSVLATPNENYDFSNFALDSVNSTNNPYTFTMNSNHTLDAYFGVLQRTVTINAPTNGNINQTTQQVANGTYFNILAIPDNNYQFDNWIIDGVNYTDNPESILIINDTDISVYFSLIYRNVTIHTPTHGNITETSQTVVNGTLFNLTANPDIEYVFSHWTINGVSYFTNPFSFYVASNTDVYATFSIETIPLVGIDAITYLVIHLIIIMLSMIFMYFVKLFSMIMSLVGIFYTTLFQSYYIISDSAVYTISLGQLILIPLIIYMLLGAVSTYLYKKDM